MLLEEGLTEKIISAAIEAHRELGPGLLESAYQQCFCRELNRVGFRSDARLICP
jgi:GxxExxY protein